VSCPACLCLLVENTLRDSPQVSMPGKVCPNCGFSVVGPATKLCPKCHFNFRTTRPGFVEYGPSCLR